MVRITAIVDNRGSREEYVLDRWFLASEDPLYLGLITKPSSGLWESLSAARQVILEVDGVSYTFSLPYRIEVGESSIFFATTSGELSAGMLKP